MMTGWRAYGMLAFHPYRRNQLSHSPGQQAPYKEGLSNAPFRYDLHTLNAE